MTDIEIARSVKPLSILSIAKKLGINKEDVVLYGNNIAKIRQSATSKRGKLILVSAINPTKAGIGKTTVSIGLADAFSMAKKSVCLALREPSLGPVFGVKGGATGGGQSQIIPMEDINLHFTGDFHAITSANNLLCSIVDNHIFQGNKLNIDINNIFINRCLDLNDRVLRDISLNSSYSRKETFNITAASEVMAILSVAENLQDLKNRLGNILVALNTKGQPLYARDFKAEEAMTILLKEAIYPNLVQTLAGTPALVHCGPFANIAHGCNSVRATKLALSTSDYVITEAGFGADLGAEKFIDFKCRVAGIKPDCVVLVATIKALKLHGGADEKNLNEENLPALNRGLSNLIHHIKTIKEVYNLPVVVTLNKYLSDTKQEINHVKNLEIAEVIENDVWAKGGKGAVELKNAVEQACLKPRKTLGFAYDLNWSVQQKINAIVQRVYGGTDAVLSETAKVKLKLIYKLGFENFPIIMAKTQFSLSDNKTLLGAPKGFKINVDDIEIRSGAGFLVVKCGNMLLMPGLNKTPAYEKMRIDRAGNIEGLF